MLLASEDIKQKQNEQISICRGRPSLFGLLLVPSQNNNSPTSVISGRSQIIATQRQQIIPLKVPSLGVGGGGRRKGRGGG